VRPLVAPDATKSMAALAALLRDVLLLFSASEGDVEKTRIPVLRSQPEGKLLSTYSAIDRIAVGPWSVRLDRRRQRHKTSRLLDAPSQSIMRNRTTSSAKAKLRMERYRLARAAPAEKNDLRNKEHFRTFATGCSRRDRVARQPRRPPGRLRAGK
jgi:hypothetical protein